MKTFVCLAALLWGAISLQAQDLKTELTALRDAWGTALERGDATALAANYVDEIEFVNDDGSVSVATRANVKADWKKNLAVAKGEVEFSDEVTVTRLSEDKAVIQNSAVQTMTSKETGEARSEEHTSKP